MEKIKYGMSGYLAPDGIFYECDYGKHSELAIKLIKKYQIEDTTDYNQMATNGEFIKFGTYPWSKKEGSGGCHVFKSPFHPLSLKQAFWIKDNRHRLTDKQRFELEISLQQDQYAKVERG